ncbi:MAG: exo-alpha-sialidase [Phycisphaeraceae bacterium]|nr:exo-alpha-sialidase [Phycisphaeraceae bacterium]
MFCHTGLSLIALLAVSFASIATAQNTDANDITIPGHGVIIDHLPSDGGIYVGSPSIAILPDGDYVASHDLFGPNSGEFGGGTTPVFRSSDRGLTWQKIATVKGQYWSNLFVHDDELYLFGTSAALGDLVIRKSADGGVTWTEPKDESTGLLKRSDQQYGYHTSSMPMLIHNGRIWRAYEAIERGQTWATQFRAGMCSAPVDSDLLNADNWTHTNWLRNDKSWLAGKVGFNGWLEGNAVAAPDGQVLNIMRVDVGNGEREVAAHLHVVDEHNMEFNASRDIHPMPGAAKKFNIRFNAQTNTYWTVASIVNEENYQTDRRPAHIRNQVAIMQSPDLINWTVERVVIKDLSDVQHIGFQYLDWQFDGRDIIAACRTAFPDAIGPAHNYHDADFLTFHRFADVLP